MACCWRWVAVPAALPPPASHPPSWPPASTLSPPSSHPQITQGCFRQFRSNMEKDPVYGPGATLFFDQCDSLTVQAASLDEIKGKPASLTVPGSVSSASIQPAQVIRPATPVVDEPLVAAADMAEPPAAEPVPEGGVTGELVAGTVIEAAKAKNLTQLVDFIDVSLAGWLLGLWGEACGLGEDAGQSVCRRCGALIAGRADPHTPPPPAAAGGGPDQRVWRRLQRHRVCAHRRGLQGAAGQRRGAGRQHH